MIDEEFQDMYPFLAPTLVGLGDSDGMDDEENARHTGFGASPADRIRILTNVLADAHRVMANIDQEWKYVSDGANRQLDTKEQTRDWLLRVMTAWREELGRLQNVGAKPPRQ